MLVVETDRLIESIRIVPSLRLQLLAIGHSYRHWRIQTAPFAPDRSRQTRRCFSPTFTWCHRSSSAIITSRSQTRFE